jgi:mono/diheme cytochrome c family protein
MTKKESELQSKSAREEGAGGLSTLFTLVVLVGAGLGLFVWSGIYSIGADVPHWPITLEALKVLRNRAVEHQSQSIAVPADLDSQSHISDGAKEYAKLCSGCHLRPGNPSLLGKMIHDGLYPKPPEFAKFKGPVDPRIAFWVTKHGIKMSAMPAWGASENDDKIWNMVAFVRKLPGMTAAQYDELVGHGD